MGYKENTYIIDPEIEDDEQPIAQKEMEPVSIPNNRISREHEFIEVPSKELNNVEEEIYETAVVEGLVEKDEDYIGGEGAKPEEVIDALIHKERSKGAQKNEEEYIDSKIEKNRKVMATRDILTGMAKKVLTIKIPTVLDVKQRDGTIKPELCDVELKVRKLTESQFNHLVNRRLATKKLSDMTEEEYQEDNHFRSNYLAETVIDPEMTPEEWYYEVSNDFSAAAFAKIQEVLNNMNDVELFQ